jgi:hypothetical protein
MTTADDVTRAAVTAAVHCLDECLAKIEHCAGQLADEQVWWRPRESLNSIGNLLLHLSGNLRQWIVSGVGGAEDVRDRPAEFTAESSLTTAALLAQLRQTVSEAKVALARANAAAMLAERRIQGFDVTGWGAVFSCIPHFQGHTQEIIGLTRQQLGDAYRFYWQPQTPEQGAPTR